MHRIGTPPPTSLSQSWLHGCSEESVGEVLKREYPSGVDLVYESVGGEMFETCLNALAVGGRIVVIGMMSQVRGGPAAGPWKWLGGMGSCFCKVLLVWKVLLL